VIGGNCSSLISKPRVGRRFHEKCSSSAVHDIPQFTTMTQTMQAIDWSGLIPRW